MRSLDKILSKVRKPAEPAADPHLAGTHAGDKRFAPRRQGLLPAVIHLGNSSATIPCLVRDMSSTGARLELRENWYSRFQAPPDCGDHIQLLLRADSTMYDCKVVRRGETELGVMFVAAPETVTKPEPAKPRKPSLLRRKST